MVTQFIADAQGGKVAVVIPINDYEELIEDVADLACVAERKNDDRVSFSDVKNKLFADGLLPG